MERGNLCPEIWIHGRPVGLVIRVEVASKGFSRRIEDHRKGALGVALAQTPQHVHHPPDCPSRLTFTVG